MILNEDILSPDQPTYVARAGTRSIIDIFITNLSENISQPVVCEDLSSDHYPVMVEIGAGVEMWRRTRLDYHHVDWAAFQGCVDDNINYDQHPETTEDVDKLEFGFQFGETAPKLIRNGSK